MKIEPKTLGYICTTAHPIGCATRIDQDIAAVQAHGVIEGPKRVLVIGSSMGYGLASRIVAGFGCKAATVGVFLERQSVGNRTASAGWYNTAAFSRRSREAGIPALNINGDAFSAEVKSRTLDCIRTELDGPIDLVVYSLAAPRRVDPSTGRRFSSAIKPIGMPFEARTLDLMRGEISAVTMQPATDDEIEQTVAVMGGDDWRLWIEALEDANLLADGIQTVAYSYVGPPLVAPIYREGTIGQAKVDLEKTARSLSKKLQHRNGRALVAINKALVTQSSSAIPVVPLYLSILFRVMREKHLHEGTIDQMIRLFANYLTDPEAPLDEENRIRLDDKEMRSAVQEEVLRIWEEISTENLTALSDIERHQRDFLQLFGFQVEGVDYTADVDPVVSMDR